MTTSSRAPTAPTPIRPMCITPRPARSPTRWRAASRSTTPPPIYQEAAEKAKSITAPAGASEHQLGLCVDILDRNRQRLVYEDMNQELFKWLDEHCAEYGFIKRYPTRKLLLTGWDEPWHYRYVGREVATFIMEQGLCYEEFYAHYFPDFEY